MGGLFSKEFEELLEDDAPQTPTTNKKVMALNIDPRSPGITRTPILIAQTPVMINDPRSPTPGIIRTPLVGSDAGQNTSLSDVSTSSFNCSLSDVDAHTMQEALYTLPPLILDEDDTKEVNELIDAKQENTEATKTVSTDSPILRKRICEKDSSEVVSNLVINSKAKSAAFQVHSDNNEPRREFQRSPLRIMSDGHQRSPLSKRNIDVSSPRHIVQRKQTNKLELLKAVTSTPIQKAVSKSNSSCNLEAMYEEDKENISV